MAWAFKEQNLKYRYPLLAKLTRGLHKWVERRASREFRKYLRRPTDTNGSKLSIQFRFYSWLEFLLR